LNPYFNTNYAGNHFEFYSNSHIIPLLIIISICISIFLFKKYFRKSTINKITYYFLAFALLTQEISLSIWRIVNGTWSISNSLPLHLCGVAIILSAIVLIKKNYLLYELIYFWGMGGAIQSLLTPDIGIYGFPHFRFFQFFVSHGLLVITTIFLTVVEKYRPTQRSIWKVFLITNFYLIFIAGFNYVFDANYLFICYKPVNGSVMDFLGPWPWYILSLEVIGLISFYIYYSPFLVKDFTKKVILYFRK